MIRLIGCGVVGGACLTHQLAYLPPIASIFGCAVTITIVTILLTLIQSRLTETLHTYTKPIKVLLTALSALMLGTSWTVYLADARLSDTLDPQHENVVTRVVFRVTNMRQDRDQIQMFQAKLLDPVPDGIPRHIQVIWRDRTQTVLPGQVWRAALVLRRPHGALNPHGFDYEGLMFQRNIRAIGQVRGEPRLISDDGHRTFGIFVDRVRHQIRAAMQSVLKDARYGPVLIALAIGDQDGVSQNDWDVFNRTGITHLVSISGSHVTMFGALGGVVALWIFKRLKFRGRHLCDRWPARPIAASFAMLVAFLYCLLAGWGVPARRTFLMLAVTAGVMMTNLPFTPSRVLCVAAALVTILDPWAPLSTGFWLSFIAVGILFSVASDPSNKHEHKKGFHVLKEATRLQWIITLAMLPILAYLFQQVSLSSMFANAIAIPVMTFIVTPFALMTALLAPIEGMALIARLTAWLGHEALFWMMYPIQWMSRAKWAMLDISGFPIYLLFVSLGGIAWSMMAPGIACRWAGWFLMLPALTWQPLKPSPGSWKLWVFDVGQGAAALISTHRHHILYDTGKKSGHSDSALRVLLPALRALGVRQIDWLVVSHGDLDHAGGLDSLLKHLPVKNIVYSAGVDRYLHSAEATFEPTRQLCDKDISWSLDDVQFQMLNSNMQSDSDSSNARSCVLKVQGNHHRALLPGDIGIQQEAKLIKTHNVSADVVLMPHHGSRTSSSDQFISMTQAAHAVAQVGHLNRFRHPDQGVVRRWQRADVQTWRSDHHGAVYFESSPTGLAAKSLRDQGRRYWHHPINTTIGH